MRGARLEELYNEFVSKLLRRHRDDNIDLLDLCSEPPRGSRRWDDEWRRQYYYRCLSVRLIHAFRRALSQCRNYITTADILADIPFHHFYATFRMLCEVLGGIYDRGKCFHFLLEDDWIMFIRLRKQERDPDSLLAKWREYVEKVAEQRKRELPQLLAECRRGNGAPPASKES